MSRASSSSRLAELDDDNQLDATIVDVVAAVASPIHEDEGVASSCSDDDDDHHHHDHDCTSRHNPSPPPPRLGTRHSSPPLEDAASISPRARQRRYVSRRLSDLQEINAVAYTEIMIEPVLQYFVANLCELKVADHQKQRIGLRYAQTPEVEHLKRRLRKAKASAEELELAHADPNAIISVLRQVLLDFPGGIYNDSDEEFLSVNLHSRLDIAIDFVHGLVQELPVFLRQFTYLVCKSLRNLDLLMIFTPVLFSHSIDDVSRFLRASRITLIMVDMCDSVFKPFLNNSALTDSAYHSDQEFYSDVLNTLNQLSDSFHYAPGQQQTDADELESWIMDGSDVKSSSPTSNNANNNAYYHITYL